MSGTPADPTIDFVTLSLGDTELKLCYDFNALATLEESTGVNFLASDCLAALSAKKLRTVLHAGALKAHPDLTEEQVGALMSYRNMGQIVAKVVEALTGSMPEADPNAEAPGADAPAVN